MAGPLSGCRLCCVGAGSHALAPSVSHMASELGATYSLDMGYGCTHIVSVAHLEEAVRAWPWVKVVHPRWLTRCFNRRARVAESEYEPVFYHAARRCGTRTSLGWRDIFFDEVGLFQMVEDRLGRGVELGRQLHQVSFREHAVWVHARDTLLDTVFWGRHIRNLNWRARRSVMLALKHGARRRGRLRMRVASDGPAHVLLSLASIDRALVRCVVEYL